MAKSKSNIDQTNVPLGELVDRLGPINNRYRKADGIEKVEALWDLGEALIGIAPSANDQLLKRIHEHSYITRDILRYGLIVRRGWDSRDDLRKQFPTLSRYSLFRAALPFLKGDRYGVNQELHAQLIKELNSGDTKKAKAFLTHLKEEKIGRTHKKGQAAGRMSGATATLQRAMRELFSLVENKPDDLITLAQKVDDQNIVRLSQACVAIAQGGQTPNVDLLSDGPEPINSIGSALKIVMSSSRDDQNGFRKAVGALVLMQLGDLLNAIRSEGRFQQWRERRRLSLSF
jgi:hypothetical protein